MKWVLLLVWVWSGDVTTKTIEVQSRALCESQAAILFEEYRDSNTATRFDAFCIQKSQ